jgi:signal transduction histidine kinase
MTTTTTFKEVRKQFLQSIISESDRLNRLIDKILDLEIWENRNFIFQKNISKTNTLDSVRQLIINKNITVEFTGAKTEIKAFYDEERIIQVIHNLQNY